MTAQNLFTQVVTKGRRLPPSEAQPAAVPIVPSVGYTHASMVETDAALGGNDFVYARNAAPNGAVLEELLASIEAANEAVVFSTGMAALHASILAMTVPGGVILAAKQLYGVTRTLLDWMAYAMGYSVHYADFLDEDTMREAVATHNPQLVVCEVITNPLGRIVRLDKVIEAAHSKQALVMVDNTFATPYLLRPLEVGADAVIHSTTKFLNGHGDVMGGVVAGNSDFMHGVREYRKLLGANMGAFEAWLTMRGIRTFALRMRQACENAMQVASFLQTHPKVEQVFYAGLPDDASHHDAKALLVGYGATVAFQLAGVSRKETFAFVEGLRLIQPVTSLGDIYSEISHPATSSHRALEPVEREQLNITEGTLRLSVGIEAAEDIIRDLEQALTI